MTPTIQPGHSPFFPSTVAPNTERAPAEETSFKDEVEAAVDSPKGVQRHEPVEKRLDAIKEQLRALETRLEEDGLGTSQIAPLEVSELEPGQVQLDAAELSHAEAQLAQAAEELQANTDMRLRNLDDHILCLEGRIQDGTASPDDHSLHRDLMQIKGDLQAQSQNAQSKRDLLAEVSRVRRELEKTTESVKAQLTTGLDKAERADTDKSDWWKLCHLQDEVHKTCLDKCDLLSKQVYRKCEEFKEKQEVIRKHQRVLSLLDELNPARESSYSNGDFLNDDEASERAKQAWAEAKALLEELEDHGVRLPEGGMWHDKDEYDSLYRAVETNKGFLLSESGGIDMQELKKTMDDLGTVLDLMATSVQKWHRLIEKVIERIAR